MKIFCQTALALAVIAGMSFVSSSSRAAMVDVEIVLAVDASGSINSTELQMQLDGIAAAFRDEDILRAITSGPNRRISASLLIWSDAAYRKIPTKWHLLKSRESAEEFAAVVETFSKNFSGVFSVVGGGTGIGDALAFALKMIEDNKTSASRRIVDISGDGIETPPWSKGAVELPEARAAARLLDVTVNGLTIMNEVWNLDDWYRRNVIVGPGSFVIKARNVADYGRAIKRKLLRELQNNVIGRDWREQRRRHARKRF